MNKISTSLKCFENWIPLLCFFTVVCSAFIYLMPTVRWLDSPELSVAIHNYGISHPPGQPLFVSLMSTTALFPLGDVSFKIALANVLLVAFTAVVLASVMNRIFSLKHQWLAYLVSVMVFTQKAFLVQATSQELYILHLFLVVGSMYVATDVVFKNRGPRALYAIFFSFGISMANHLLLGLVHIGFISLFTLFVVRKRVQLKKTYVMWAMTFYLLGFSLFLFLPLRAAVKPILNFGNPVNFEGMLWVITGKLYTAYGAITSGDIYLNAVGLVSVLWDLAYPVGFLLALSGWYLFFVKNKKLFFVLIGFLLVSGIPILMNREFYPSNPDAQGYLLVTIAIFGVVGLLAVLRRLETRLLIILPTVVLLIVAAVVVRPKDSRESDSAKADEFLYCMLHEAEYGSEIWYGSYESYVFGLYSKHVFAVRPDVTHYYRGFPHNQPSQLHLIWDQLVPAEIGNLLTGQTRNKPKLIELSLKRSGSVYQTRLADDKLVFLKPQGWFFKWEHPQDNMKAERLKATQPDLCESWAEQGESGFKKKVALNLFLKGLYLRAFNLVSEANAVTRRSGLEP